MSQPDYWQDAVTALSAADTVLARLIARHPQGALRSRGDAFETLARAITGQQISVKAADTVWQRLNALVQPAPGTLTGLTVHDLRQCGYSLRKAEYLHDLSRHFNDGALHADRLAQMDDDDVIRHLTGVRGIGRWSAEMFLMFHLQRPDVLPLADIGLQKAVRRHYPALDPALADGNLIALQSYAECWRPWRTVATWYLWRSLDPVEVSY